MARASGIKEAAPRRKGGGLKQSRSFRDRYAADPAGTAAIRLPNAVLAFAEDSAKKQGISTQEWIRSLLLRLETESRIV